jgi:hypothetical protein
MATYGTFNIDSVPCPHDCELEAADRASREQTTRLTTPIVARLLRKKGFSVTICDDLVHVSLDNRLIDSTEIMWALDFDDSVTVWNSPWGVSVLCQDND